MTDFERRIGPRVSPSPEPKPRFPHKSWIRSGYQPNSGSPPRKPRRSDDMSISPPTSDNKNEHSLLLRMGLGSPSSLRSENQGGFKEPLPSRAGVEAIKATRPNVISLGNHRIESLSENEAALRGSSSIGGEKLEEGDMSSPHKRVLVCSSCSLFSPNYGLIYYVPRQVPSLL
jgi:hypothetical protein